MIMKYKLLLCDVDGTLIPNRQNGMPSQKIIKTIGKANKKIKVGIATARSYWQIAHILDVLPLNAPSIITGGAQIIDPNTRKTFAEKIISKEDILAIGEIAKQMGIKLIIADRDGERPFAKNKIPDRPLDIYTEKLSIEEADILAQQISHISTISAHRALAWEHMDKVHITITHPEASKQDALLEVVKMLGIKTEEVIGVGEGYNDFPLLMACGLKVAMGNATEDVKAIADFIAPTVEEDGVATVIEKFILK